MIERHDSIIVQKVSRTLIPLIQLFALYVFFHGHYSPGGGFQAGVLLGASIILQLLVTRASDIQALSVLREVMVASIGLGLFILVGALPLLLKGSFFDYDQVPWYGATDQLRHYWGILFAEAGVVIVVSMTLVIVFHVLAFVLYEDRRKNG